VVTVRIRRKVEVVIYGTHVCMCKCKCKRKGTKKKTVTAEQERKEVGQM
jgi:hypothetical protein